MFIDAYAPEDVNEISLSQYDMAETLSEWRQSRSRRQRSTVELVDQYYETEAA